MHETGNVSSERWGQGHRLDQIVEMWVTPEQSKTGPETGRCTNSQQQGPRKLLERIPQKQKEHKKMRNQEENKNLEKKRLGFHHVSSTGWGLGVMGLKKHGMSGSVWSGSKPLILERVGFVRIVTTLECGPWATLRHAQSSAKWEKLTYCYSSPKENCCVTTSGI